MRSICVNAVVSAALASLAALMLVSFAVAQDSEGLTPSFGDGQLTISGGGFQAGERITITVKTGGTSHQFMATADTRGRFRLATGLVVRPGASVELEARGDRGTVQAAITSGPGGLPVPPAPGPPQPAGRGGAPAVPVVPEGESLALLGGGLAALGSLQGVRWWRRRNR